MAPGGMNDDRPKSSQYNVRLDLHQALYSDMRVPTSNASIHLVHHTCEGCCTQIFSSPSRVSGSTNYELGHRPKAKATLDSENVGSQKNAHCEPDCVCTTCIAPRDANRISDQMCVR